MKSLFPVIVFALVLLGVWKFPLSSKVNKEAGEGFSVAVSERRILSSRTAAGDREIARIKKINSSEDRIRHLAALAFSIPVDQLESWLRSAALNSLDQDSRMLFTSLIHERWFQVAPEEFLKWNQHSEDSRFFEFLPRWVVTDREAAMAFFFQSTNASTRGSSMAKLITGLVSLDPELVSSIAREQLQSPIYRGNETAEILEQLATRDPELLLSLQGDLPMDLRAKSLPYLFRELAKKDFARSLDYLGKNLPDDPRLRDRAQHVIRLLSYDSNFGEIVVNEWQERPGAWFGKMIEDLNGVVLQTPEVFDLLGSSAEDLGLDQSSYERFLSSHASIKFGVENNDRLIDLINNPDLPLRARSGFLANLASWHRDSESNLDAWLDQVTQPDLQNLLSDLREDYQSVSTPLHEETGANEKPGSTAEFFDQTWTEPQLRKKISHFQTLNQARQREVFESLWPHQDYSRVHPEFGSEVIIQMIRQDQTDQNFAHRVSQFANHWASEDPAEAAEWAASMPEGEHRSRATKTIARVWQKFSPSEAKQWIKRLPDAERVEVQEFLTAED